MASTGKIGRLKKVHRDQVNQALRDNMSANGIRALIQKWIEAGERDADGNAIELPNDPNISHWRSGAHQQWLKEQERLEDMDRKREFALAIVTANEGSKIHEASLQLAATQLYETISEYDLQGLKDLVHEKPENYAKLVNSLAKLSTSALDIEKFKENVAARKQAIEATLTNAKRDGGLSADTIAEIEEQLKLL
jgi:hypothetical protein